MSAVMNGLALYGGIIPYGGTFLIISDGGVGQVGFSQSVVFAGKSLNACL